MASNTIYILLFACLEHGQLPSEPKEPITLTSAPIEWSRTQNGPWPVLAVFKGILLHKNKLPSYDRDWKMTKESFYRFEKALSVL